MNELEILKQYADGRSKYSSIVGRMNVELSWSKFATKSGIIDQLRANSDLDRTTVFYMVSEDDAFTGEPQMKIYREYFTKLAVAG